jgi:hypothetical protein
LKNQSNQQKIMKNLSFVWTKYFVVLTLLFGSLPLFATNISVTGNISTNTTWSSDTVKVTGDITIPVGVTLTINPGCKVLLQGYYKISVLGSIVAVGQPAKLITFTVKDTTGLSNMSNTQGGWHGLRFPTSASSAKSTFSFCVFEYSKASGSGTDGYGGAIYGDSHSGVFLDISSSIFRYCYALKGGAIYINNSVLPFRSNLVYSSIATEGGAIYLQSTPASIFNCTIIRNRASSGGGIYCASSSPYLINSILYNNDAPSGKQIFLNDDTSDPYISYCDLEGGKLQLGGTGASSYTGVYEECVDENPLFFDVSANKYQPLKNSICINNGNPDVGHFTLSTYDVSGNIRVNEGRVDIGAYESYSPYVSKRIRDTALIANLQSLSLDMNSYFKLNGVNNSLSYSLTAQPDTNTVSIAITNNLVKITPKLNKTGIDTIIIKALSINGQSISDTFMIKVDYPQILVSKPANNYHFTLRDSYDFNWGPIYPAYPGQVKYILKVVEVQTGQTPEQAMANNAIWYSDTSAYMAGTLERYLTIAKRLSTYANMAWQVKAIDQADKEFAATPIYKFIGPPLLEAFYAENTIVTVDTTWVNVLSDLSGRGRVTVPYLGTVTVSFSHLNIGYSGVLIALKSGAINQPYPYTIDLTPEYAGNGKGQFVLDTLNVGTGGIYFKGTAKWKPTFCDTTVLLSKRTNVLCDGYLIGVINFKNQKKSIDALPGSFITIDSTSAFIARGGKYALGLTGTIIKSLPSSDFEDDTLSLAFNYVSRVDYLAITPSAGQKVFKVSNQISVLPESYYLDLSATSSPALFTSDATWKGIWVNKFKTYVASGFNDYNIATPGTSYFSINAETNRKNKFYVDANDIAFTLDTIFTAKPALIFNGFNGTLSSLHVIRPFGLSKDTLSGTVIIPYINETSNDDFQFYSKHSDDTAILIQSIVDFNFAPVTEKAITSFAVLNGNAKIAGTINETNKTISFKVPTSMDLKKLTVYFTTTGSKVTVNGVNQVRGVTQNNFTNVLTYTVAAGNGDIATYQVSGSYGVPVEELSGNKANLRFYPNPVEDVLVIENPYGKVQAIICAMDGSVVRTINFESYTKEINVAGMAK